MESRTRYNVCHEDNPSIEVWQGYADTGVDALAEASRSTGIPREQLEVNTLS